MEVQSGASRKEISAIGDALVQLLETPVLTASQLAAPVRIKSASMWSCASMQPGKGESIIRKLIRPAGLQPAPIAELRNAKGGHPRHAPRLVAFVGLRSQIRTFGVTRQ